MENVFEQMVILVLIVLAGYIANRCGLFDKDLERKFSSLIINVTCPLLIAGSVMSGELPDRGLIVPMFLIGFASYVLMWVVCAFLPRFFVKNKEEWGQYSFMLMFANVGFMGYPIVASIFGEKAVFYAALLNMSNTFFVFTSGLMFVSGEKVSLKNMWKRLFHPAMIGCYVAIVIVVFGLTSIPRIVSEPVQLIGRMTVPGSLMVIGSSMAGIRLKGMANVVEIGIMTVLRLLAFPLMLYGVFYALGFDPLACAINATLFGMPVASMGTMFCLRMGKDDTAMVQGTLVTTLLSVLTIPLLTMLLQF